MWAVKAAKHELPLTSSYIIGLIETCGDYWVCKHAGDWWIMYCLVDRFQIWNDNFFKMLLIKHPLLVLEFFQVSKKVNYITDGVVLPSKEKHYFIYCWREMINILNVFGKRKNTSQLISTAFKIHVFSSKEAKSYAWQICFISWNGLM